VPQAFQEHSLIDASYAVAHARAAGLRQHGTDHSICGSFFRSKSEKTNHKKKKSTAVKTIDRAPRNLCD
jgi:hypothetical protein